MTTCIPEQKLRELEKEGVFDIKNSVDREEKLSEYFGATKARELNIKFEKTKLLKNTELGFNKFIDSQTEEGQKKLASLKEKMKVEFDRKAKLLKELQDAGEMKDKDILDIEKMADDIFKKKHGLTLSDEQVSTIKELTNEIERTRRLEGNENRRSIKYGQAMDALDNYVAALKNPTLNMKFGEELGYNYKLSKEELNSIGGIPKKIGYIMSKIYNTSTSSAFKNMKATLDLSYFGIQGMAALSRNPLEFVRGAKKSFEMLFAKDVKAAYSAMRAETFADRNFEVWNKVGLRQIGREEQIQSVIAEKTPGIGKLIQRADAAFSAFLQTVRKGEANRVLRNTEKSLGRKLDVTDSNLDKLISDKVKKKIAGKNLSQGEINKITDKVTKNIVPDSQILKEIAAHANKVSGTTNLGPLERYSGLINKFLFAGRFAVSDLRMYTDVLDPAISMAGRKRAAATLGLNWGMFFGGYLAISAIFPDKTDLRPNSANFMRIKGDNNVWSFPSPKGTWAIKVLAKMVKGSEITSRGHKVPYRKGYKSKTRLDVLGRLLRSKLSPQVGVATDLLSGSDFIGRKNTPLRVITNLTTPIAATNIVERIFSNADLKDQFLLGFFDAAGINGWNRH